MGNNALAMEKIPGSKNESSPAARKHQEFSKRNEVLRSLGGSRGSERKRQLVGETEAGERNTAAWLMLAAVE